MIEISLMKGLEVGGNLKVDYEMMEEFIKEKNRGRWMVMMEGLWEVGKVVIEIEEWEKRVDGVEEEWRYILIVKDEKEMIGIWMSLRVKE